MTFSIDTSKPLPGPYRLPTDNERRNRLYLEKPYKDITTVCELNPDIQEHTDATLRLFREAPAMKALLEDIIFRAGPCDPSVYQEAKRLLAAIEKGT